MPHGVLTALAALGYVALWWWLERPLIARLERRLGVEIEASLSGTWTVTSRREDTPRSAGSIVLAASLGYIIALAAGLAGIIAAGL